MLVGIISDTHDALDRTRRAVDLLAGAGAEALVHGGDFTTPAVLEACLALPLTFVYGNNDADAVPDLRAAADAGGATCLEWGGVAELGGRLVGVAHGHMTADIRRVLALRPDFLLTGHSHETHDRVENGVRRLNPGALFRAAAYTVMVLDLATDEARLLPVPR